MGNGEAANGGRQIAAVAAPIDKSLIDRYLAEKVVDIVADGDRVVTRYISTATHEGEFQGIPATGRKIEIAEVSIHRVLNGKIVEQWGFPDGLSHVQQMTE